MNIHLFVRSLLVGLITWLCLSTTVVASPQVFKEPTPPWVAEEAQRLASDDTGAAQFPVYLAKFFSHDRFMPDGQAHHYYQFAIKGNDRAALQRQARQELTFNPAFQRLVVHTLGVIRDGRLLDHKDHLQPLWQPVRNDLPSVYLGRIQAVFELPDVRLGDTLVVAFSFVGSNPVFGGRPFSAQPWYNTYPILERIHEVSWHNSMSVRTEVFPSAGANRWFDGQDATADRRTLGDWTLVRHRALRVAAPVIDDLSAPGDLFGDVLQASAFTDWAHVRTWAKDLFDAVPAPQSAAFAALVADLQKISTPDQRAVAALRWVQREIRYVSLSLGDSSHRPHAPDEVLIRRYGDCKDKTLLLVHLLRSLGLRAYPALMSQINPQLPSKTLPSPGAFDHAAVTVWIDGRMDVFDATLPEQTADWAYLAPWHAGADLLVLDDSNTAFASAPVRAYKGRNAEHSGERLRLTEDGHASELTVELVLQGAMADRIRWRLASEGHESAKRHYLGEIRKRYPDADWAGAPEAVDEAAINKLTLRGRFVLNAPLRRLPGSRWRHSYTVSEVFAQLPTSGGVGRRIPLALNAFLPEVTVTRRLELPSGWSVAEDTYTEAIHNPAFLLAVERSKPAHNVVQDDWRLHIQADRIALPYLRAYLQAVKAAEDLPTDIALRASPDAR